MVLCAPIGNWVETSIKRRMRSILELRLSLYAPFGSPASVNEKKKRPILHPPSLLPYNSRSLITAAFCGDAVRGHGRALSCQFASLSRKKFSIRTTLKEPSHLNIEW